MFLVHAARYGRTLRVGEQTFDSPEAIQKWAGRYLGVPPGDVVVAFADLPEEEVRPRWQALYDNGVAGV